MIQYIDELAITQTGDAHGPLDFRDAMDMYLTAGWQGDGYYWWDDSRRHCVGPFNTKGEAQDAYNDCGGQL